ncbi:MAG: ribbon-helix-helix domain-containing protein [Pseudomonadota bacterium]
MLIKRSITLGGHATSVALEPEFWSGLEDVARDADVTIGRLIELVDAERGEKPLASALRVAALNYYKKAAQRG